jgi:hypothetical protein
VDHHEQFVRPCWSCGAPRMHVQRRPNRRLHRLLTVFTVGLWLPVWVLVNLFAASPTCMTCGEKSGRFVTG